MAERRLDPSGHVYQLRSPSKILLRTGVPNLSWIQNGKALYLDKEKIQKLIDQQRTNLADVTYLDLDSVSNVVENLKNPSLPEEKIGEKSATSDFEDPVKDALKRKPGFAIKGEAGQVQGEPCRKGFRRKSQHTGRN